MKKIKYTLAFFERALLIQILEKKPTDIETFVASNGFGIKVTDRTTSTKLSLNTLTLYHGLMSVEEPAVVMLDSNDQRDQLAEKIKLALKEWSDR